MADARLIRDLTVLAAYQAGCPVDSIARASAMDWKRLRRMLYRTKRVRPTDKLDRIIQLIELDAIKSRGSELSHANGALYSAVMTAAAAGCSTGSISRAGGSRLWDDHSDFKRAIKRRRGR